jgi:hypothetical protein
MATISKVILSGSTNGLPISVTGADSANAVDIHDAGSGTSNLDEVWLWATNVSSTVTARLVIEFGSADEDQNIVCMVNPSETIAVVPGIPLCNSKEIEAFASVGDLINIFGYVNRITA